MGLQNLDSVEAMRKAFFKLFCKAVQVLLYIALRENCPDTEFLLVRILPYSD